MKDLRIVIVSWNVAELLERCVTSLPDACRGLAWDCVVVDNASADASVKVARHVASEYEEIHVIENLTNVGFGMACNQGVASRKSQVESRYILFLNPDTFCHPDSIARFIHLADERPKAGILGPKLTNPDGRAQESIRRFPDVWSQAGILLKLHHLFPGLPMFKKYFARDLNPEQEQVVEQVMGACFLVRRACWDAIGGFDERFFIWFEEVDRCLAATKKGWEVRYLPQVQVVHHGGESFAQVFTTRKQRYFNESLIKYFQKWQPTWQSTFLRALAPIGLAEAWVVGVFQRHEAARWIALTLGVESFSFLTFPHPTIRSVGMAIAAIVIAVLAWKKPAIALGVLLLELLIGGKGGLLQFGPINGRVILTAAFFVGWTIGVIGDWLNGRRRELPLRELLRGRSSYLALFALILFATIRGVLFHDADVFHDVNAWFDLAMLFPVIDLVRRESGVVRRLVPIFFVGIFWLAIKTLALELLFSHGLADLSSPIYLWVRRTGVGELTSVVGNAYRIFMQSDVYAVAGWLVAFGFWMKGSKVVPPSERDPARGGKSRKSKVAFFVMAACAFTLAVSLSRSFWIGAGVGAIAASGFLLFGSERMRVTEFIKRLWGPITAIAVALALFAAIIAPTPITNVFFSRTNVSEPGAASRWELLPILWNKIQEQPILGSGFGATVTYATKDPRALATNPDGLYTTYAFEWGWLDHWIKFGILGIPVMLWVLVSLGRRLWKSETDVGIRASGVACLIALVAIHVFTPYLNHPLGFLFLLVGEGIITISTYEKR